MFTCVYMYMYVCVNKQMFGPGSVMQVPIRRYFVLECWGHSSMKSKNRTCACWSRIKPQNGGLKFFFQEKFKGETLIGKTDKRRVVLVEVGMRGWGGLET